jgi:hypothetical protein
VRDTERVRYGGERPYEIIDLPAQKKSVLVDKVEHPSIFVAIGPLPNQGLEERVIATEFGDDVLGIQLIITDNHAEGVYTEPGQSERSFQQEYAATVTDRSVLTRLHMSYPPPMATTPSTVFLLQM